MAKLPVYIVLCFIVCSCFESVLNQPEVEHSKTEEAGKITLSQDDTRTCSSKDQDCNDTTPEGSQDNERLVRLDGVKVGHVQDINIVDGQTHQLITRSMKPPLFEIADFLSKDECDNIIQLAKKKGLEGSSTLDKKQNFGIDISNNTKTNKTYKVDENQEQKCQEMIAEYDLDKSGNLSGPELVPYLDNITAIIIKENEVVTLLQELKFDENGDGELSYEECLNVSVSAIIDYLNTLKETHPSYRPRVSQTAWLPINESSDAVLLSLRERIKRLTGLSNKMIEESEQLQVVRYTAGGHFHAHYDSTEKKNMSCCRFHTNYDINTCNLCRYMTILYYLNDVTRGGETAFPVADNETFHQHVFDKKGLSNLSTRCRQSNIVVPPRKGTAILWYNHHIDPDTGKIGPMDKYSLHGGCDVQEGVKWIANNWINGFN